MRIAICGKICSGKSTLANALSENFKLRKISFANPVKMYAEEIFDMKYKDRKLIQDFAEKMKEINPNVWIDYLDRSILEKEDDIVIDDLRFMNEYNFLRTRGFFIIRINIEMIDQIKRIKSTYPDKWQDHIDRLNHVSEIDRTIFNADLDIESTDDMIEYVLEYIRNNVYNHVSLTQKTIK